MFSRPLSQCSNLKSHLFWENQPIFVECLPIDFFYFEDFQWSIFGKITGQNYTFGSAFVGSDMTPILKLRQKNRALDKCCDPML